MTNRLCYGDNFGWLSNEKAFPDESVDLVYLDPPFNSNATYSQLFKSPDGKTADSQTEAFEDTWNWGVSAEAAYDRVLKGHNTDVAQLLQAMRRFLHDNALMAYLAMMAARAAAAGFHDPGTGTPVPRIQIITLAELFAGKRPVIPNVNPAMFKAAPVEAKQQGKLF